MRAPELDFAPTMPELVLRCKKSRRQGEEVTPEELCRGCPELLDELKRRLDEGNSAFLTEDGTLTPLEADTGPPSSAAAEPSARISDSQSTPPRPGLRWSHPRRASPDRR